MKAVVLVGGFGTRLRPLTLATPKQMLPVVDRPMIEHVVGGLAAHGVDEVVLALGYRPDAFVEAYPDGRCAGVSLHYAPEPEPLDTAGAIAFAARHADIDETFFVVNGDVMTDADLGFLWRRHHEVGAQATIHLTPVDDPSRYGVVPTDDVGRVVGFVEKPDPGTAPTNWINAGTYVMDPAVLELIEPDRRVSVERETFPLLVEQGSLWAVQDDAYWIDTGTPATYIASQLDLVSGRRTAVLPDRAPSAAVAGDARVSESVLMADTVIEPAAVVERSVVLPGGRVEQGATVVDSIVGNRATVGAGATVSEWSIVGEDEAVPAGVALVDARIPEAVS